MLTFYRILLGRDACKGASSGQRTQKWMEVQPGRNVVLFEAGQQLFCPDFIHIPTG